MAESESESGSGSSFGWGKIFEGYGYVAKAATKIGSAWGSYYNTTANSAMTRASAALTRYNAQAHLSDAAESIRMSGQVQKSGLDSTTNLYLQLAQDIGHVYSGAAGGGIDVASATVRHVDQSARAMADRDVSAISRSAYESARQYNNQALNSRLAYVSDMANARMMEIQASYQNKVARSQARAATWSAVAQAGASIGAMAFG